MTREYRVVCAREPDLPALAGLLTPELRDRWRSGAAAVAARVTAGRWRWRLEVVAERPEDEPLALAMAVATTIAHDGFLAGEPSPAERERLLRFTEHLRGPMSPREHLTKLLAGEVGSRALAALAAGAACDISDTAHAVEEWRSIFGRRERTSRRAGQGSIGFEAALRALGAYEGVALVSATVDGRPDGGFWFQLFLTPDLTRVVAGFGVARPRSSEGRHPQAPEWTRLDEIVLGSHPRTPAEQVAMIREQDLPDVPAGIAAGLERHLATRHWGSFGRYVNLVPDFPSPAAAGHLVAALDLARSDPYLHAVDVVTALAELAPPEAVPVLARTARRHWLRDYASDLALHAMDALLHIDTPESRAVMASLVDDEREPVRELAREVAEDPGRFW
ncbi:HEAT repeat domain-containing protein [Amycolatopsis sp. OK19-0408]|uniref:HEAT repeat domain-containing protein n=1 Tax=Amycolatopsis iheyensis TaxID=2945988 RepID=A0A9X2SL65_9PSEU|nr:HEAT repeat domain-containing protein [Amycolatopsis iheyensis]MCR6484556.1 HEAT repeat domain-containing protein [Amycolatopsis iheyensis]